MLHWALIGLGFAVLFWLIAFCCGSVMILLIPGCSCGENVISPEFKGVSARSLLRTIAFFFCIMIADLLAIIFFW